MKKTLLITLDFPPLTGGVARYYENLCAHLPSDKIVVLAHTNDRESTSGRRSNNYIVYRKNFYFQYFWPHWIKLFFLVLQVIRKEKIKHIFIGQILPVGTVVLLLSYIFHFHYTVITHAMDVVIPKMHPRKKFLIRSILRRARCVTTVSSYTQHELLYFIPKKKIQLIPPGVSELSSCNRDIRKELHWEDRFILLSVSRLVERKGHDKVLEAIGRLTKTCPYLGYIIVGKGPMEPSLRQIMYDHKLESFVHFSGFVSDEQLSSYYQACDAFILPVRHIGAGDVEGFGIVFLEAALFKKMSIAGNSGGVSSAVIHNETGILVDPLNTTDITKTITLACQNRDLVKKLGSNAYERAIRDFHWKTQAHKFEILAQ